MKKLPMTLLILLIATTTFAQTYTYSGTVDGDILNVVNAEGKEEIVQLLGIDSPEAKPNAEAVEDSKRSGQGLKTIVLMGQKAAEFLRGLIKKEGQEIRLEFDQKKRDKYGRLLAYVYSLVCEGDCAIEAVQGYNYEKLNDGWYVFINATIIKSGYATPMTIPPNVKYADLFKELYEEAREAGRGLWGVEENTE